MGFSYISGSCEIKILVSGKYAAENPVTISASPDLFRQMALYTMQECFVKDETAGFITHNFGKAVDWVLDLSNDFPTNLAMPSTTTYFTALVWKAGEEAQEGLEGYNPGDSDPESSVHILDALFRVIRRRPLDSDVRADLERKRQYMADSWMEQEAGREDQRKWWASADASRLSIPASISNSMDDCRARRGGQGMSNCTSSIA